MRALGHNNDVAKRYPCVKEREAKLFCVKASDTGSDWSLQESCKLLMAYSSSRESCELVKQHCFDKTCVSR